MPVPDIPLGEIFTAADGLRAAGLIREYALGGALAAVRYTEPFTTYDADIFFIPSDPGLSAGIPAIFAHLRAAGYGEEGGHTLVRGFPVQWLAARGLTEEAVREAEALEFDGVPGRVFRVEHLVVIAASVGRPKDRARVQQLLEQGNVDRDRLADVCRRHHLTLPRL